MEREQMVGKVIEVDDDSRLGCHWDVSNESESLSYLLEQYHGKKVKITIEVLD